MTKNWQMIRITDVSVFCVKVMCPHCDWRGTVVDCESTVNSGGNLQCPECLTVVLCEEIPEPEERAEQEVV